MCMCVGAADLAIQMKVVYFLYWPVEQHKADGFIEFPQASLCLACQVSKVDNTLHESSFALACRK